MFTSMRRAPTVATTITTARGAFMALPVAVSFGPVASVLVVAAPNAFTDGAVASLSAADIPVAEASMLAREGRASEESSEHDLGNDLHDLLTFVVDLSARDEIRNVVFRNDPRTVWNRESARIDVLSLFTLVRTS